MGTLRTDVGDNLSAGYLLTKFNLVFGHLRFN